MGGEGANRRVNWGAARQRLGSLTSEEERILELLDAGRTQPEIAEELGLHRSAVWRRIRKLRNRLESE